MPLALHGPIQFTGEIAALTAALFWAVSSILFKKLGKTIPPIEMNLLKGTLAIVLFFVTSLVLKEKTADLSLQAVLMLAVSGALGIGYGDTVYFEALNILGARRTLLDYDPCAGVYRHPCLDFPARKPCLNWLAGDRGHHGRDCLGNH